MTTHTAAEAPQGTPGQHRDASGHLKDTPDGYTDLAETHGWGLRIFIFLADVSLSIRAFYDNIKGVLVGASDHIYLDPNGYKKGKGQVTSQIEFRCQHEQTGQKSDTNSPLILTNGETVSHNFSCDRQAEKEMGSARKTTKTWKILGQAVDNPGRAWERGSVHQTDAKAQVR